MRPTKPNSRIKAENAKVGIARSQTDSEKYSRPMKLEIKDITEADTKAINKGLINESTLSSVFE